MFTPHVGPQYDLLCARNIPEILFGGARGGGKTATLLGDFLQDVYNYNEHWRGILFRRTYPELEEVIRQSVKFFSPTGAQFFAGTKTWKWKNGASLKLRSLEKKADASKYQGHEYCLAFGEKILTKRGNIEIQNVIIGDEVYTANGFSLVTNKTTPKYKDCVKVTKENGQSQIQSIDHKILTVLGWQSYASLQDITSKEIREISQEFLLHPSFCVPVVCVKQPLKELKSYPNLTTLSHNFYKSLLSSKENSLLIYLLLLKKYLSFLPSAQLQKLIQDCKSWLLEFDALNNEQTDFELTQDSRSYYRSLLHFYGEQLLYSLKNEKDVFPLLGDVAKHLHECCTLDARDNTHKHNHYSVSKFLHPYDESEQLMAWENSLEACEFSFIGQKLTIDIEVQNHNNYITAETGIINKNCYIGWDEITNWADHDAYKEIIACLRSSGVKMPQRIRATGNPGGRGHQWVKDRWQIGKHKQGWHLIKDENTGLDRLYIPSRTDDNPSLLLNSPNYVRQLRAVGSKELVRAWLEGDWDIVLGAYFDEWNESQHVIDDIEISDLPRNWKIYRAYDHGSYHPFVCLWYTIAGGGMESEGVKKGSIIFLREYYGGDNDGKGLKMSVDDVALGIKEREKEFNRKVEPGPADNQIFEEDGGRPLSDIMASRGVYFTRSDKRRVTGWNQVRYRLQSNLIKFCRSCVWSITTIPNLQHDDTKHEDVDTTGNDHCLVGETLVDTPIGQVQIKDLNRCGEVWTHNGWQCYDNAGIKQKSVPVIKITFSDGQTIRCTPDHKFMITTGEWIEAKDLLNQFIYREPVCQYNPLVEQSKNSKMLDIINVVIISKEMGLDSIEKFGSFLKGKSLQDLKFTIKILIKQTTILLTLSYSNLKNIGFYTHLLKNINQGAKKVLRKLKNMLFCGTNLKKVDFGIKNILQKIAKISFFKNKKKNVCNVQKNIKDILIASFATIIAKLNTGVRMASMMLLEFVKSAVKNLKLINTQKLQHVGQFAEQNNQVKQKLQIIKIESSGLADVYCLHVPLYHHFSIEGGIITHNCGDVVRYSCMAWPVQVQSEVQKEAMRGERTYQELIDAIDDLTNRN